MGGGARTGPCRKAESGEEPLKEFIREMTLRIERGGQAVAAELRGLSGEVSGMRGDMRAFGAELRNQRDELRDQREELRDQREESRAQTRALLQVLDLEGGGPAPAT
jgi:hypothetical protein